MSLNDNKNDLYFSHRGMIIENEYWSSIGEITRTDDSRSHCNRFKGYER